SSWRVPALRPFLRRPARRLCGSGSRGAPFRPRTRRGAVPAPEVRPSAHEPDEKSKGEQGIIKIAHRKPLALKSLARGERVLLAPARELQRGLVKGRQTWTWHTACLDLVCLTGCK